MTDKQKIQELRTALLVVMDSVDYTKQNCSPTDQIASILSVNMIKIVRSTLQVTKLK